MRPILKLILPSVIAVVVIVPSMLIRIPNPIQIRLKSQHLSFLINQDSNPIVIPFELFNSDKLELTDFDHVLFEAFDLYIFSNKQDTFPQILERKSIEITPLGGRWKEFSKLYIEAEKEESFFMQSLQSVNNAKLQFAYQSEDWLLFQVDEPIDSIFMYHKPILNIFSSGQIHPSIDRCNVLVNGKKSNEILNDSAKFFLKPASEFSMIKFFGEERKFKLRIHLQSAEQKNYSKVEVYNPEVDKWESDLAAIPTPRQHAVTAVVNDQIYVIGGDIREDKLEIFSNLNVNNLNFIKSSEHQGFNVEDISIVYDGKVRDNIEAAQAALALNTTPYSITNLDLTKESLICSFNGSTKGGRIDTGIQNTALSPTIIEWIYKNQFFATAFGAMVWLIGTLYFLIREWGNIQKVGK